MSTLAITVLLTLACCTTAHLVVTAVMALYARYQIRYLPLACIMGIFTAIFAIVTLFSHNVVSGNPGLMHPDMLSMLVVGTFLQSFYTLGITMPGYLQLQRMLRYAIPAIIVILVNFVMVHILRMVSMTLTWEQLLDNILSLDVFWRLATLAVGLYYFINIFLLPRQLAQRTRIPLFLFFYTTLMFCSGLLYLYVSIDYSPPILCLWLVIFTLVNMLLVFPELEAVAQHLSHPYASLDAERQADLDLTRQSIRAVQHIQDFNEMNLVRYNRVQYWMQNNRKYWCDYTFNRDMLCDETGINRQLLLQCLRSQGHNNVHDYLTLYRVEELRRLIYAGQITSIQDCDMAGFGSAKTARSAFERTFGLNLDQFIAEHAE